MAVERQKALPTIVFSSLLEGGLSRADWKQWRKTPTLKTKVTVKAYGTGKSVKWSVSNKRASISKKGKFKARKRGKVYVVMKSGNIIKKYLVKIK